MPRLNQNPLTNHAVRERIGGCIETVMCPPDSANGNITSKHPHFPTTPALQVQRYDGNSVERKHANY